MINLCASSGRSLCTVRQDIRLGRVAAIRGGTFRRSAYSLLLNELLFQPDGKLFLDVKLLRLLLVKLLWQFVNLLFIVTDGSLVRLHCRFQLPDLSILVFNDKVLAPHPFKVLRQLLIVLLILIGNISFKPLNIRFQLINLLEKTLLFIYQLQLPLLQRVNLLHFLWQFVLQILFDGLYFSVRLC